MIYQHMIIPWTAFSTAFLVFYFMVIAYGCTDPNASSQKNASDLYTNGKPISQISNQVPTIEEAFNDPRRLILDQKKLAEEKLAIEKEFENLTGTNYKVEYRKLIAAKDYIQALRLTEKFYQYYVDNQESLVASLSLGAYNQDFIVFETRIKELKKLLVN